MGLVLLHGFLGRFEDSHCSAMVAFLLELGRILGEGRKDFHRFEGELARSLCASRVVACTGPATSDSVSKMGRLLRAVKPQIAILNLEGVAGNYIEEIQIKKSKK